MLERPVAIIDEFHFFCELIPQRNEFFHALRAMLFLQTVQRVETLRHLLRLGGAKVHILILRA